MIESGHKAEKGRNRTMLALAGASLFVAVLFLVGAASYACGAMPPDSKPGSQRDPLAVARQIDHEIQKGLDEKKVPASPLSDDAEFCRRVHLDIIGCIPTAERAAAFLDSKDPDKRRKLIDELLARPEYGQFFGAIWRDLVITDTSGLGRYFPSIDLFRDWMADSFNQNRPWSGIVSDMLISEGKLSEKPQQWFLLTNRVNNEIVPTKVAGSTVQLFMGIQLHCAECHRHPFIKEWKQEDFWGLAAFFSRVREDYVAKTDWSYTERDSAPTSPKNVPAPLPSAIKINTDTAKNTGTVVQAKFFEGELAALGNQAPYRPALAAWLTAPQNKYFARAAVNRWWAHFFAHGLVNPIDDMHDGNPPSHPELFQQLTAEFTASGFDLKHLVRCLCNSQTYQRTSKPLPGNRDDDKLLSHMPLKVLSPEQLYNSLTVAEVIRVTGPGRMKFFNLFDAKNIDDPTEMIYSTRQFLMLMNDPEFNRGSPKLTSQAPSGASPAKVAEGLYLAMLARRPTAAEVQRIAERVAKSANASQTYSEVLWALVNCAEFIHNH